MVTLEMLIILLKELVMYTEDNTRHSYLNDRHLALIEVENLADVHRVFSSQKTLTISFP